MNSGLVKKGLVLGIIILLIEVGIMQSSGGTYNEKESIRPLLGGNTLYVGGTGPENYTKIQDAINDSVDGDTVFVYDDSSPYFENIIVNKSINLIGEDKHTTVIDGRGSGDVVSVSMDWVNISGYTIRNSGDGHSFPPNAGIKINSNFNTITGNTISNNNYAIYLYHAYKNIIQKNNLLNNERDAFFFGSSNNQWNQNYWNRPRILPKLILGQISCRVQIPPVIIYIPWLNIDWRPAIKSHDI